MSTAVDRTEYFAFESLDDIERYLRDHGLISADEAVVSITKPGEGNMNFTARVTTDRRSIIVKQAKPFVEKYPSIAAPQGRAIVEATFYEMVARKGALRNHMPQLLHTDRQRYILVLEDVGSEGDYCFLYTTPRPLGASELGQLLVYLEGLHDGFAPDIVEQSIQNREMRRLNAEHIFRVPLNKHPALDLDQITPGLSEMAADVRGNAMVVKAASRLERYYLEDGETLLHGDYFPGAWLRTQERLRIIDPEFCFHGPAEFDVGVFLAHLMMTMQDDRTLDSVRMRWSRRSAFSLPLANGFAGIEIIRRLLGLAQLPLKAGLSEKRSLIDRAVELLTQ